MNRLWRETGWGWIGAVVLPAAVCVWLVAGSSVPLGVAGEWTWERPLPLSPWWGAALPPLLMAGVYVSYVFWRARALLSVSAGDERSATGGDLEGGHFAGGDGGAAACGRTGWELVSLSGLCLLGFGWLWQVQESAPVPWQLSKAVFVLYFPGPSGYFTQARYHVRDTREFLAGYESRVAEGDVLHQGTHPPGLVLAYRGLMALCDGRPGWVEWVLATQPASVREALDVVEQTHRFTATPLVRADRAVLWLAALLVQGLAVATVVPMYLFLRQLYAPRVAWLAAALWPLVPALAVFLPKSDALFPCLGMTFLWLWHTGVARRAWLRCAAAGLVFWLGLVVSLAMLPVGMFAGVWTVWFFGDAMGPVETHPQVARGLSAWGKGWYLLAVRLGKRLGLAVAVAVGVMLIATLLVHWGCSLNLLAVWSWNYHNHAAFYQHYTRSYGAWLLVNPLELALAVGTPVFSLAMGGMWLSWRERERGRRSGWGLAAAFLLTWGVLWLTGKNRGEAARLWLVTMPWLVLQTAPVFAHAIHRGTNALCGDRPAALGSDWRQAAAVPGVWWWGVLAQIGVTLVIVTRVSGFHLPN